MRYPRFKLPDAPAFYHCISRVVDRKPCLGEAEKEYFVRLMREYEAFCGVRVLTYSVMSNHFHILVEVPPRPAVLPTAEEVIERLRGLSSGGETAARAQQMIQRFRSVHNLAGERAYLEGFYRRMWDVSPFMKALKQRFSNWYNRRNERRGTLWEERFKSAVVEGAGETLVTMAAYIDLNPVRAGIVQEPQDYRWCGYAEAMAGQVSAREGLKIVVAALIGRDVSTESVLEIYRCRLFGQGEERDGTDDRGRPLRKGFDRARVLSVIRHRGVVSPAEYVRCRVRYFADGVALGSRAFVEHFFQRFHKHFGQKRPGGARELAGLDLRDFYNLRRFPNGAFG